MFSEKLKIYNPMLIKKGQVHGIFLQDQNLWAWDKVSGFYFYDYFIGYIVIVFI